MTDPRVTGPQQTLEPVQAGPDEVPQDRWARRLVLFLRGMAGLSLVKGLYHWAVVCGLDAPTPGGFADYPTPYQSATAFFAVIDLVAAVVWLTSVISMIAVELLFPQIYGGRMWLVEVEFALVVGYLFLALLAAREQPA
jgi:hypothetical protein